MENSQLNSLVKTLQIISAALIMGVVMFAIVTLVISDWEKASASLTPLGILALAIPLVSGGMSLVLPGVIFKQAASSYAQKNPKPEMASLLRASGEAATTQTIIGMALREGGAILGVIVWMIESNVLGLIGAFIGLGLMILTFPTLGKVEQKLADFRAEVKAQQRGQ
jgi:hypothetical protein